METVSIRASARGPPDRLQHRIVDVERARPYRPLTGYAAPPRAEARASAPPEESTTRPGHDPGVRQRQYDLDRSTVRYTIRRDAPMLLKRGDEPACIALAWNAEYDSQLLNQTAKRHGQTLPPVLRHGGGSHHAGVRDQELLAPVIVSSMIGSSAAGVDTVSYEGRKTVMQRDTPMARRVAEQVSEYLAETDIWRDGEW